MSLRYRLEVQSSHIVRRLKRLLMLLVSKDFRRRRQYFNARMRVTTDSWLEFVEHGERNPAYDEPGADLQTENRYTVAATTQYRLGIALAYAKLSLDFLAYSDKHGYGEGKETALTELQRDLTQVAVWANAAKSNNTPVDELIKRHPWAANYLTS